MLIELHGTALSACGGFGKKEEGRITDGDLIPKGKHALADRNAVDERAGGRIEIAQGEAAGGFRDGAMLRSDGRILKAHGAGRVAPDGDASGDRKAGVFPGTADDGESWGHVLGLGRLV